MKIFLVSTLYSPHVIGGAERVVQDLAEAFVRHGKSVTVACLGTDDGVKYAELGGVRVHYLPLRNLYWPYPVSRAAPIGKAAWHAMDTYNVLMARAVGRLLDEIRPDVVNTHNLSGFSVSVWKAVGRRGMPLVHTLHDHYLLCPYTSMFKDGRNCARRCVECRIYGGPRIRMTRGVDGVIGVSRYILEKHLESGCFPGVRSGCIYSGCQQPAPQGIAAARGSGPPLRVGFLGRVVPIKGVDRLIDAYSSLPVGVAELWIAGAGDPEYEASLKRRAAGRPDVRWLGFVEPRAVLPELDVLVVPSLVREAMGRVVLEALSFGLPVIGANRGGIPELIDETCGWIFDPDSDDDLKSILRGCLAQPARLRAMREAAHARSQRFSLAATVSGYLAAYRDAIAGSGKRPATQ